MAKLSACFALLSLLVALLAGCGGGDRGQAESATTERDEFLAAASAICRKENAGLARDVAEYIRLHEDDGDPRRVFYADLAHWVLLPTIESQMAAVGFVGYPPRDKLRILGMFSDQRQMLDQIALSDEVDSVAAVYRAFGPSARAIRAYGLPACANGPGSPAAREAQRAADS